MAAIGVSAGLVGPVLGSLIMEKLKVHRTGKLLSLTNFEMKNDKNFKLQQSTTL